MPAPVKPEAKFIRRNTAYRKKKEKKVNQYISAESIVNYMARSAQQGCDLETIK